MNDLFTKLERELLDYLPKYFKEQSEKIASAGEVFCLRIFFYDSHAPCFRTRKNGRPQTMSTPRLPALKPAQRPASFSTGLRFLLENNYISFRGIRYQLDEKNSSIKWNDKWEKKDS